VEALVAYEQAIRLAPKYATAYRNNGDALTQLGFTESAHQAYERARQLNENG
jgi:tetratricopeptide (TPR) repeat protein